MSPETTDAVTFAVWIVARPAWLVWELALLWWRGHGTGVKTISMVAQRRAWQLSVVPYLWAGMASHWWWPSPVWATVWGSVVFWLLALLCLGADVALWSWPREEWPTWLRWARVPLWYVVLGLLAGALLFPQRDPVAGGLLWGG